MNDFFKKIVQKFNFLSGPRVKILGCFLIIVGFAGETIFRKISYLLAKGLLFIVGADISGAGNIVDRLFAIGAPIIFVYIPATIVLWLIIKDGLQKLDWIWTPILIGILAKGEVYGIISLRYKTGEFWQLSQYDFAGFFLWFLILTLLISGLVGLIKWFKNIS